MLEVRASACPPLEWSEKSSLRCLKVCTLQAPTQGGHRVGWVDNFLKFSLVVLSAIFNDRDRDSCLVSVESSPDLPIPTREDTLVQRPRLDTGKDIFTQLTSVLNESCSSGPAVLVASAARTKNNDGDVIVSHAGSPSDTLDAVRLIKYCFTDLLISWLFFLLS